MCRNIVKFHLTSGVTLIDSGSQEDDKMSPDRQTGIAKLPYAIAWLKDTIRFQDNGRLITKHLVFC